MSTDHVRQQSEEACALDRLRELALLLRRYRSDAARHDLAALGDVALQQPRVLVVDLGRIGARERTGLAAAEERAACLGRCKAHGHYSSLAGASPLGGRLSRSRSRKPPLSRSRNPPRSRSRSRKPPRSRSRKPPPPRSSRSRSRSTLRIITEGPSSCSSTRTVR